MTQQDSVDRIIEQWNGIFPDLYQPENALLVRLIRCGRLLDLKLQASFADIGLNFGEFDVLSNLRRNGGLMSPTELYSVLFITSGTITHRLKLLEKHGLVSREPNPDDSRSQLVRLTDEGRKTIDEAIAKHLANQRRLVQNIPPETQARLSDALREWLLCWEGDKGE